MKSKYKNILKLLISIVLSGIILYLIYSNIDVASFGKVFSDIRIWPFVVFLLLFIPQLWIASKRWNVMTQNIGKVNLPLYTSFKQVVGSYSANMIIPGKMGEIVRIPWMKKYNLQTPVLIIVLLEKIFDILSVLFILLVAAMVYLLTGSDHKTLLSVTVAILVAAFALLIVLYLTRKRVFSLVEKKFETALSKKNESFFYFRIRNAISYVDYRIGWYLSISMLLWLVQILEFYFIFLMFNISPSVLDLYVGISLALLAGALPISVAGLGPRDAVIIRFFGSYAPIETLAGVGVLSLFRILVTALIGLPFFMMQTRKQ